MSIKTATGNHDFTGSIDGVFYKGVSCTHHENKRLKAETDITIGGSCGYNSSKRNYEQEDYKTNWNGWSNVVTVPAGKEFSMVVTNSGDLENFAEVEVTIY
jgi:hypothetical protein